MAKKLKKEKLQCGMFEANPLYSLKAYVLDLNKTWNRLPAEKQQQAREFIEEHKFLTSFEDLDALLRVAHKTAFNLYDALQEVVNESPEFKEFIAPGEEEQEQP